MSKKQQIHTYIHYFLLFFFDITFLTRFIPLDIPRYIILALLVEAALVDLSLTLPRILKVLSLEQVLSPWLNSTDGLLFTSILMSKLTIWRFRLRERIIRTIFRSIRLVFILSLKNNFPLKCQT